MYSSSTYYYCYCYLVVLVVVVVVVVNVVENVNIVSAGVQPCSPRTDIVVSRQFGDPSCCLETATSGSSLAGRDPG